MGFNTNYKVREGKITKYYLHRACFSNMSHNIFKALNPDVHISYYPIINGMLSFGADFSPDTEEEFLQEIKETKTSISKDSILFTKEEIETYFSIISKWYKGFQFKFIDGEDNKKCIYEVSVSNVYQNLTSIGFILTCARTIVEYPKAVKAFLKLVTKFKEEPEYKLFLITHALFRYADGHTVYYKPFDFEKPKYNLTAIHLACYHAQLTRFEIQNNFGYGTFYTKDTNFDRKKWNVD